MKRIAILSAGSSIQHPTVEAAVQRHGPYDFYIAINSAIAVPWVRYKRPHYLVATDVTWWIREKRKLRGFGWPLIASVVEDRLHAWCEANEGQFVPDPWLSQECKAVGMNPDTIEWGVPIYVGTTISETDVRQMGLLAMGLDSRTAWALGRSAGAKWSVGRAMWLCASLLGRSGGDIDFYGWDGFGVADVTGHCLTQSRNDQRWSEERAQILEHSTVLQKCMEGRLQVRRWSFISQDLAYSSGCEGGRDGKFELITQRLLVN